MNTQPDLLKEAPPPDTLLDLLLGTVANPLLKLPILRAGIELQVWAKIAEGCQTASEIASAVGADSGGMRRLLDALTVIKLLEKNASSYRLPDWAEYYLLPDRPTYLGNFVLEWLAWEGHGQLAEAIRTGKHPITPDVTRAESVGHFIPFYAVRALAPRRYIKRYDGYWQALQVEPRHGLQILDLACGVGIASHALALQHPGVRVTLQDWPAMLEFALEAARKLGVEQQVTMLPGDMFSVDYGQDKFDIARLGFVTYLFGPDELVNLFHRVHTALKPSGMLAIEAPLSDEGHCENEEAVVDGPWLYAVSAKGDVYSFLDYKGFLEQAGFDSVTQVKDDLIKAEP
jgi:3-hydroxy-5-methyl-1-naphthoate 3-O-methyltransferase